MQQKSRLSHISLWTKKIFLLSILCLTISAKDIHFKRINIIGNNKTKNSVITSRLLIKPENTYTKYDIDKAQERIKELGIFSSVKLTIKNDELQVHVSEKWTTIPILKVSSGGGVSQITTGVFDPNILGNFIEAGAQYQRLEDTNSGVLWLKNPYLYDTSYGFNLQAWKINRLRTKYDQYSEKAKVLDGFLHIRDKFYLGFTKEYSLNYQSELFYEYNNDEFSNDLVPEEAKAFANKSELPPSTKFHFIGASLDVRDSKRNNLFNFYVKKGISKTTGIKDFYKAALEYKHYSNFKNFTIANRFKLGGTNTDTLQYWTYLGGLDSIRGFADNRFAGRYFWLNNFEIRHTLKESPTWILQSSYFIDIATNVEDIKALGQIRGASVGAGARLILPKVYRFILRLDYAKPIKKEDGNSVSLGVQQFF